MAKREFILLDEYFHLDHTYRVSSMIFFLLSIMFARNYDACFALPGVNKSVFEINK